MVTSRTFRRLFTSTLAAASLSLSAALYAADPTPLEKAESAYARGDFATALKEADGAKGADRAKALLLRARIELKSGKYADAEKTAKTLAALGKEGKVNAAPIRAQALASQGKTADAITVLKDVEGEDTAHRARVLLGELLIRSGKRGDATVPLKRVIQSYNDDDIKNTDPEGVSLAARAAQLLRLPKQSNDLYNKAERVGAKRMVEPLLWRTELFLDKYDPGNAGSTIKDALKVAPKDPDVHIALARVKLENAMDFDGAEAEINQALEVNPGHTGAFFVRAGLALRDMDIAAADAAADQGLKTNPNDLELLSMKAAIRFLADDNAGFEAIKNKVVALNPEYSTFYQIVGEFAEWEHRYEDIVSMMREAVKVDKRDAKAWATLGLNLIRSGDETAGVDALREAWKNDKFNVRVYNTLDLYEKDIATGYVTVDGTTFKIRYAKDEKAILERYVPKMLEEAWKSMVSRYGFTPKTPVQIELYSDTQDFSVRTSGLPNVGIQGVCFGQTLAALSPAAAPFNWGNVLWHELGHVFAIQMSKNHVPRWYTEGLSEYETIVRRAEWQREEDPALFAGLRDGRIPMVDSFNRAFTHVDSAEDVTMAYFAASQIIVFMAEKFGFPKVVSMMPKWAAGKRTPEVVQEALGISSEELDKQYRAWLKPRLSRYDKQFVPDRRVPPLDDARKAVKADPKNGKKLLMLARALGADGQDAEAEATFQEALKTDPKEPNLNYELVRRAMRKKDTKEAQKLLEKMIADGHDGYTVRMMLADIAEAQEKEDVMKKHLEEAYKLDTSQVEPLQALYDMAHKKKDADGELAALRRIALLDQHDRRVWSRLLKMLVERGLWEEARKVGESAIFVDVANAEIHRLYARALARTGNHLSAIFELNSAVLCHPKDDVLVEIYEEMATGYDKLKSKQNADQARDYARQVKGSIKKPDGDDDEDMRPKPKDKKPAHPPDDEGT
ncbi:MAG: tetratricopeptide repeat protein [Polyangiaceae bacterium]|nr:tetratricopeptide repeat protein [Polyangiaceae bacterium]